ncbi:PhzF family phenazine biosynthesis protein, partial [Pseudomonas aeruginosa]
GVMPGRYTASQGTALGRRGRISVEQVGGDIWIGGEVQPGMSGRVVF